jgi:trk system potassium uptake protein
MRALVLGCGRIGSGVARELASRDVEVVAIDHDPAALARLGDGVRARRLTGSVLDQAVLLDGGIEHADAVAAVTGDDEVNAVVALVARRRFAVPTVIARLYDPRTAELNQLLGVRTLAPITWGVQRIADLVTASSVTPIATLGAGGVEIVDVRIPALLNGRTVAELTVAGEIEPVALTRHGRTVLATPATSLSTGDVAHVAVAAASLGRLAALVGDDALGHG